MEPLFHYGETVFLVSTTPHMELEDKITKVKLVLGKKSGDIGHGIVHNQPVCSFSLRPSTNTFNFVLFFFYLCNIGKEIHFIPL